MGLFLLSTPLKSNYFPIEKQTIESMILKKKMRQSKVLEEGYLITSQIQIKIVNKVSSSLKVGIVSVMEVQTCQLVKARFLLKTQTNILVYLIIIKRINHPWIAVIMCSRILSLK